jgi:hypothetical protein
MTKLSSSGVLLPLSHTMLTLNKDLLLTEQISVVECPYQVKGPQVSDLEEKLLLTERLCEADGYAYHHLWYMHTQVYKTVAEGNWEQLNPGHMVGVAMLDGRPVNLELSFLKINGTYWCFYTSASQVVDWKAIEEWLEKHTGVHHDQWTDANNFHP